MDLESVFKQNDKIVYREEEDGAFLFDPDTGDLRYMNLSGRETFSQLNGDRDIDKIVRTMMALYPEIEPSQVQQDVENFLRDLLESHFILPAKTP